MLTKFGRRFEEYTLECPLGGEVTGQICMHCTRADFIGMMDVVGAPDHIVVDCLGKMRVASPE